jgi:hypothetical protein
VVVLVVELDVVDVNVVDATLVLTLILAWGAPVVFISKEVEIGGVNCWIVSAVDAAAVDALC